MESEKVKEIKKALECCGKNNPDCDNCPYSVGGGSLCRQPEQDALTLINELESENERLMKLQARGGCRVAELGIENQQLKDRIAELEKKNGELKQALKKSIDMQKEFVDQLKTATKEVEENLAREISNLLKQFAERLKAKMPCEEIFKGIWDKIDETLKEFINE